VMFWINEGGCGGLAPPDESGAIQIELGVVGGEDETRHAVSLHGGRT